MPFHLLKTNQYNLPMAAKRQHYVKYMLVLSLFILITAFCAIFILSAGFPFEKKYDEMWCKTMLSRHDKNVLSMGFSSEDNGVYITKSNTTIYMSGGRLAGEYTTMRMIDGSAEECGMTVLSFSGANLVNPRKYSCSDGSGQSLSTENNSEYLYIGNGIAYPLSDPLIKEKFRQLNLTKNMTGVFHMDTINYYRPDQLQAYESQLADAESSLAGCEVGA